MVGQVARLSKHLWINVEQWLTSSKLMSDPATPNGALALKRLLNSSTEVPKAMVPDLMSDRSQTCKGASTSFLHAVGEEGDIKTTTYGDVSKWENKSQSVHKKMTSA